MVSDVFGCEGQRGLAEIGLKVDLSMESKMYRFHMENKWFLVSLGAMDRALSQKEDPKLASVWKAKCMNVMKKIIGFWCLWVRGTAHFRRDKI